MARLSAYRNIIATDYAKESQVLVTALSLILNSSFTEIYSALNNKLTFQDNFAATITTISLNVDKTGAPTKKTSFKLQNGQTSYQGIIVMNAIGGTPTSGIFVTGSLSGGIITVTNVQGLQPLVTYNLTLLVL